MSTKEQTLNELEKAKKELEIAIKNINDISKPAPSAIELKKITDSAKAVLDINGICT